MVCGTPALPFGFIKVTPGEFSWKCRKQTKFGVRARVKFVGDIGGECGAINGLQLPRTCGADLASAGHVRHLRAFVAFQAVAGRQVFADCGDGVDRAIGDLCNAHAGGDARALCGRAGLDSDNNRVPCAGCARLGHK